MAAAPLWCPPAGQGNLLLGLPAHTLEAKWTFSHLVSVGPQPCTPHRGCSTKTCLGASRSPSPPPHPSSWGPQRESVLGPAALSEQTAHASPVPLSTKTGLCTPPGGPTASLPLPGTGTQPRSLPGASLRVCSGPGGPGDGATLRWGTSDGLTGLCAFRKACWQNVGSALPSPGSVLLAAEGFYRAVP